MKTALRAAVLALALAGPVIPASAGDPEGLDPKVIDDCVAGAASQGAHADCALKGVAACREFWKQRKPDMDPAIVSEACTDDERQLWDARLEASYKALIGKVQADRPDEVASIRAMERAWIVYRDARCEAERTLYGHGTGGAMALPECKVKETARQDALLTALLKDE